MDNALLKLEIKMKFFTLFDQLSLKNQIFDEDLQEFISGIRGMAKVICQFDQWNLSSKKINIELKQFFCRRDCCSFQFNDDRKILQFRREFSGKRQV